MNENENEKLFEDRLLEKISRLEKQVSILDKSLSQANLLLKKTEVEIGRLKQAQQLMKMQLKGVVLK